MIVSRAFNRRFSIHCGMLV